ncbi:MAG TPA: folylpolyglutamate synthase/dihydrofolate synthase family protein [Thermoplasmata archaeon]|nr:folylpolyglutamate synthase/dihydrofolate synthase family protein [Thermoplasmata archaeon]
MPPSSAAYRAALDRLYRRRRFGLRPGLEVERALLAGLGDPQRAFPAVHVTGSKGKGSVAVMTAAILSAHGLRTGLFTSPHLASYRERIRRDGRTIAPGAVVEGVERIEALAGSLEAAGRIDRSPTFFEVTTALGLDWFARQKVDAAVVEVGIGGRLDSTNVLDSRVGVISTIELEHTDLLGSTLEAIAEEKSGILRPGMRAVTGALPDGPAAVVHRTADRLGVPLWRFGREITTSDRELSADGQSFSLSLPGVAVPRIELPLLGGFQVGNAALACAAAVRLLDGLGKRPSPDAIAAGLARVKWPGRLERVARRPELFYDVAHTPESARAVAESLGEIAPLADPAESAILFGCLRGKSVLRILDALTPLAQTIVLVRVRSERALPAADLRVAAAGQFPRIVEAPDAVTGLRLARVATGPDGLTLAIGSDYLIGELLRGPGDSDEPDLSDPGTETVPAPGPAGGGR